MGNRGSTATFSRWLISSYQNTCCLQTLRLGTGHTAVEGHAYLRLLRLYLEQCLPRTAQDKASNAAAGVLHARQHQQVIIHAASACLLTARQSIMKLLVPSCSCSQFCHAPEDSVHAAQGSWGRVWLRAATKHFILHVPEETCTKFTEALGSARSMCSGGIPSEEGACTTWLVRQRRCCVIERTAGVLAVGWRSAIAARA